MNRSELQLLTKEKILGVKALLRGKRWSSAYYVSGYVVECALKSCVLSRMPETGLIFEEKPPNYRIHDFQKLVDLAGLKDQLDQTSRSDSIFAANWQTVGKWRPEVRYIAKAETEARLIFDAITSKGSGVLPWIKTFW